MVIILTGVGAGGGVCIISIVAVIRLRKKVAAKNIHRSTEGKINLKFDTVLDDNKNDRMMNTNSLNHLIFRFGNREYDEWS